MTQLDEQITLRPPERKDAQAVFDLMIACDIAEYGEPDSDIDDLLDDWSDIDLTRNAWLAYNKQNELVGYAAIYQDSREVFHFDLYVHPALAKPGLNEELIDQCEKRTQVILYEKKWEQATASIIVAGSNQKSKQLVEKLGYTILIYHFGMAIHFENPPSAPVWLEGISLRSVDPEKDDRLIYDFIQNAFERPGRIAPSFEGWRDFMLGASNFRSDVWFLAYYNNELVGAALCFAYPEYGWVRQLGVKPDWRGKGIGSALLQHAFGVFYTLGFSSVRLVVESENVNAFHLYESVGMKCIRRYAEYQKTIFSS